jgi:hypothetical protein
MVSRISCSEVHSFFGCGIMSSAALQAGNYGGFKIRAN